MSVRLDRFRAPDASDEIARCQSCGERFHYTQMDEHGHCPTCQPEEDEDNDMTEKEMNERNAWIAEHVMEWRRVDSPLKIVPGTFFYNHGDVLIHHSRNEIKDFRPTTDPAAAMQVLEKCAEKAPLEKIEILKAGDEWLIQYFDDPLYEVAQEQTLPLAICLIAQRIFRHETKT